MASIEAADATAAILRSPAAKACVSVDAHVLRLAVIVSVHHHSEVLDEQFYADAEAAPRTRWKRSPSRCAPPGICSRPYA